MRRREFWNDEQRPRELVNGWLRAESYPCAPGSGKLRPVGCGRHVLPGAHIDVSIGAERNDNRRACSRSARQRHTAAQWRLGGAAEREPVAKTIRRPSAPPEIAVAAPRRNLHTAGKDACHWRPNQTDTRWLTKFAPENT